MNFDIGQERLAFSEMQRVRFSLSNVTQNMTPSLCIQHDTQPILTHCGRVTQICVFNTVKLGTSASSPYCHSTRRNVSRGITPSSTTRVFGEYFLKISVHKNS